MMKKLGAAFLVSALSSGWAIAEPSSEEIENAIRTELILTGHIAMGDAVLSDLDYIYFEDERTGTGRVSAKIDVELDIDLYSFRMVDWNAISNNRILDEDREEFLRLISEKLGQEEKLLYETVTLTWDRNRKYTVIAEINYTERITGPSMSTELSARWLKSLESSRELDGEYEMTDAELESLVMDTLTVVNADQAAFEEMRKAELLAQQGIGSLDFGGIVEGTVDPEAIYLIEVGDDVTLNLGTGGVTLQRVSDECLSISVPSGSGPKQEPAGHDGSYSRIKITPAPGNSSPVRVVVKSKC